MSKSNSNKGDNVPTFAITNRTIKSQAGGFGNIRTGLTKDLNNVQTNPLYKTLFRRRGKGRRGKIQNGSYGVTLV